MYCAPGSVIGTEMYMQFLVDAVPLYYLCMSPFFFLVKYIFFIQMFREKDEKRSKPAVKTVSGNHLLMR